jgi:hypothetical protein
MNDPTPRPQRRRKFRTDSLRSVLVFIDKPGDTTRRPRRANIPLDPPRPRRPEPETRPEGGKGTAQ